MVVWFEYEVGWCYVLCDELVFVDGCFGIVVMLWIVV